jgi:hypothetical protein
MKGVGVAAQLVVGVGAVPHVAFVLVISAGWPRGLQIEGGRFGAVWRPHTPWALGNKLLV